MKLPFSFSLTFVFRLVIPGLLAAVVVYPGLSLVGGRLGLQLDVASYFPWATVLLGWVITLLDMHIYMAMEGRRYWPEKLWRWGREQEVRRFDALSARVARGWTADDPGGYAEAAVEWAHFPLSDGERDSREVYYPTRLGNLIAEFEQYPSRKYDMDGVFFWYRVWLHVPKDLREELDQHQALADSSLYTVAVVFLGAFASVAYAILSATGHPIQPASVAPGAWLMLSVVLVGAGYGLYRASLPVHASYGRFFKAMFDQFAFKVTTAEVLDVVSRKVGVESYRDLTGTESYRAAWRYLQWHRVRLPGSDQSISIAEARNSLIFNLYRDTAGAYRFRLRGVDGAIVATSQPYKSRASCAKGIEAVRASCGDQSRYRHKTASDGRHYFTLSAPNNAVVATGVLRADEGEVRDAIDTMKRAAGRARIVEG